MIHCTLILLSFLTLVWAVAPAAGQGLQPVSGFRQLAGADLDPQNLLRMAEQGDSRAAFLLGMRFASGSGAVRDDSEAYRWFRKAADHGLAEAQYNLGIFHATGRGTAPSLVEASRWYRLAAEQGLSKAQFNLGTLYSLGLGVPRDEVRAARWLTRAAAGSLAEAQYNLAVLYEHGRGVRMNLRVALDWYQRAADQGFAKATERLAALRSKLQGATEVSVTVVQPDSGTEGQNVAFGPTLALRAPPVAKATLGQTGGALVRKGEAWFAGLNPEHYTVQILSDTSKGAVERFIAANFEPGQAGYYRKRRKDKTWFGVVYGEYRTSAEALAAARTLPEKLRKAKH